MAVLADSADSAVLAASLFLGVFAEITFFATMEPVVSMETVDSPKPGVSDAFARRVPASAQKKAARSLVAQQPRRP